MDDYRKSNLQNIPFVIQCNHNELMRGNGIMIKIKVKSIVKDYTTKVKDKIYEYPIGNVILNKDMNVRKGWKIGGLIILGMLLQASLFNGIPNSVYNEKVSQYESTIRDKDNEISELNTKLELKKSTYEYLVKNTEIYTSLTRDEKELVDENIAEVKEATAEQLEAEKKAKEEEEARIIAEQEEANRVAAEEKAKADEEKKAKEIADKENENAINTAKQYLDYSGFSREGLIEQLEFEGYPTESATYAADNCGANWNEECAETAQQYLDYSSFSRDGLYQQLQFEGFSEEQINYGLSSVGY